LITAQEVTGLNPVKVTNKKKKSKNNQACLNLFLDFFFFQSGALLERRSQSVKVTKNPKHFKMFRVFAFSFFLLEIIHTPESVNITTPFLNYIILLESSRSTFV
jgi:hypothetical protein